jgi:hypothetical protein
MEGVDSGLRRKYLAQGNDPTRLRNGAISTKPVVDWQAARRSRGHYPLACLHMDIYTAIDMLRAKRGWN